MTFPPISLNLHCFIWDKFKCVLTIRLNRNAELAYCATDKISAVAVSILVALGLFLSIFNLLFKSLC